MGRFFDIVLIFAATVTGIYASYATNSGAVLTWLFAIVVAGLVCRLVAELLGRSPSTATLLLAVPLIFAAVAVNFAGIALASWATLRVTLGVAAAFKDGSGPFAVPAGDAGTVATLVTGAITGFLGAAFYDEAKKPDSALWPPQIFRKYLADVFGGHPHITGQATPELYGLLYADAPIRGWRFPAALARAARIGPLYAKVPPRS